LEIGPGPGKATIPMARRGFRITALELGANLAAEARRNLRDFPNVTVINSAFEDWQPDGEPFDLIYAATAWHWLDPRVRWSRAAALLRPGGDLAVFSAGHAFPIGFDPFFSRIQETYNAIGERIDGWPPPPPDELPDPTPEYEASGHFRVTTVRRYVWALTYDADSYIRLLQTFSGHIAMPATHRERIFGAVRDLLADRPDGLLTRHWVATLVVARRR
jgi:SAM-dependent methyltransferase